MEVREIESKRSKSIPEDQKSKVKELIKKLQKDGEKLINVRVSFREAQGGFYDFDYKFWPGEPVRTVRLTDGETCDVPKDVFNHLNGCRRKIRSYPQNYNLDSKAKPHIEATFARIELIPTGV